MDPTPDYPQAVHTFRAAAAHLRGLVKLVLVAAGKLGGDNWKSVGLTDANGSAATDPRRLSLKHWPDRDDLAAAFGAFHAARADMDRAWGLVPADRQPAYKPPAIVLAEIEPPTA